mgnify:CR=1 FL=1
MIRRKTKRINVGYVPIGDGAPISVQSMTKNPTTDPKVLDEIKELEDVGCDIVRISVPDFDSVKALSKFRDKIRIPIISDIHFDWRIAIAVLEDGLCDGLRLNPGNIGGRDKIEKIVERAKRGNGYIPIRIGVNSGSIEKDILANIGRDGFTVSDAMVESALRNIKILEECGFYDIKVSLKSSNVLDTIEAYRKFSEVSSYPLHLGVTEAGTRLSGSIRSAVALGILLWEGIGDTIRVSLAASSSEEVIAAKKILASLNLYEEDVKVIACPTCARTEIDVVKISEEIERELMRVRNGRKVSIAIMGCVVNGPGESYKADVGVVGGKSGVMMYVDGKKVGRAEKSDVKKKVLEIIDEKIKKGPGGEQR